MSEQNPQVRRPQTLEPQENPSPASNGTASGPPSGVRGAAATYGLNNRPSGIRPLPELPPGPDVSFKNFGLLNAGEQSKTTLFTSVTLNITTAIILCLLSLAAKKVHDQHVLMTSLVEPVEVKKQEEKPKPKPPPLPKLPPPPTIEPPMIEPPKIQQVKLDMPKPVTPTVQMKVPLPVLAAAPLKVNAPAAPKLLNNLTQAASVRNNDSHPTAVALGSPNNPMQLNPNSRSVSHVNLGNAGMAGMPSSNTGRGPVSLTNNFGSGAPNGSVGGRAHSVTSIAGLSTGVPGGQGTARTTTAVNIAPITIQQQQRQVAAASGVVKPPTITSKANPQCTQDAKNAHIEGQVSLNVIFTAGGSIQVLGVVQGLGHGLDQAAVAAAQVIRYQPATTDGRPSDFRTVIRETFACGS
ncbi:MAG TPA: TonB family protein [Acidobacteriaceae bacterium]|jgi:protein TonB|nr:TonB family protein [Acidobacteriaceae bacterium]